MHFAKILQNFLDHTLPDWKSYFLNYKALKKQLKAAESSFGSTAPPMTFFTAAIQIVDENPSIEDEFLMPVTGQELSHGDDREEGEVAEERTSGGEQEERACEGASEDLPKSQEPSVSASAGEEQDPSASRQLTEEDENFLRKLKTELHKFNDFFLEKEEEFLIRLSILEEKTDKVKEKRRQSGSGVCDRSTYDQLIAVQTQVVTLHGEMVLLLNYSSLNYVGLLKILKKYDRHTKSNLRQLVHGSVLQQPFVRTTNLQEMIARSLTCGLQSILPTPDDVVEPIGAGLPRDVAGSPNPSLVK